MTKTIKNLNYRNSQTLLMIYFVPGCARYILYGLSVKKQKQKDPGGECCPLL